MTCCDLIEASIRLMQTPDNVTEPVNIGNPVESRIIELAELIIALTGSSSAIEFKPLPSDDPKQRKPDIRLARRQLDWEPKTPLEDGLRHTIAYFENLLRDQSHQEVFVRRTHN